MIELKDYEERKGVDFSYSDELGAATIGSALCSIRILSDGTDSQLGTILSGNPFISGSSVFQFVRGGVPGLIYEAKCVANLSDGRILTRAVVFRVIDMY